MKMLGINPRNDPLKLTPANPLPPNAMSNNTGDAGLDGYSVLSRASRETGERPRIGGESEYWGPRAYEGYP
jgi:hypothetical protein